MRKCVVIFLVSLFFAQNKFMIKLGVQPIILSINIAYWSNIMHKVSMYKLKLHLVW